VVLALFPIALTAVELLFLGVVGNLHTIEFMER